jgi:hypothetical protein
VKLSYLIKGFPRTPAADGRDDRDLHGRDGLRRAQRRRTLIEFGLLTVGGWLGGTIVYVYGMSVLSRVEEPSKRAITPGHPAGRRRHLLLSAM